MLNVDPECNFGLNSKIAVTAENGGEIASAIGLAERLQVEFIKPDCEKERPPLMLVFDSNGLALTDGRLELRGDFSRMLPRIKENNLRGELLVKASRLKDFQGTPTAVDATAGLGEDAFLLASAGFKVQLFEYNPIISALLDDALCRAENDPQLAEIAKRMEFCHADSLKALPKLDYTPDVILLDPMFPARQKSGLIKKKFQLLQQLEQPCTDEQQLLSTAVSLKPRKIVIKRPAKGKPLAGTKPSYSISGKAIRYDCLVFPR